MSVAENVLMASLGARSQGIVRSSTLHARARPLLERVGADFSPAAKVDALAPGQRQLVEIAKALALDPSVIAFDEPTASLDQGHRERIYAIVRQLAADGAAVLYVSHRMHEIFAQSFDDGLDGSGLGGEHGTSQGKYFFRTGKRCVHGAQYTRLHCPPWLPRRASNRRKGASAVIKSGQRRATA